MNKEKKVQFARKLYENLDLVGYTLESKRDEEINADYIWIPNMRGSAGLIIGDDGTSYFVNPLIVLSIGRKNIKKVSEPRESKNNNLETYSFSVYI